MIKKHYRKLYRRWLGRPLSKDEFRYVVKELLAIGKGDSVLAHSSFGNLKPGFAPAEAVEILMEAVGFQGNLLMPYYPEDSIRWLQEEKIFDVRSTPTRSGILSATFSKFPDVRKSLHPIKSLAVWGKDRDYLISTHHESVTPYDTKSPYYKLTKINGAKTIGIGTYKNSFVHCAEDITPDYPTYYHTMFFKSVCIDCNGYYHHVGTYAHASAAIPRFTGFLINTNCPDYKTVSYRSRLFYSGLCSSITKHMKECIKADISPHNHYLNSNRVKRFLDDFRYKLNG